MPFTPFHFGLGAALKPALGRRFSFAVFAFSQVLIDVEPGMRMLLDKDPLHPHLHTYLGATGVALVSGWLGRPVCEWALRAWNRRLSHAQARWLALGTSIPPPAAWSAAFVGAYSHVALDSIMHADIRPWAPFAQGNALLGLISIPALQWLCVALGIAGVIAVAATARR
jgi:membrane-bound metal-dependent hydrolase YbcI (DUF457 family)